MNRISKDEVNFVKKMIYNEKRIKNNHNENLFEYNIYPQADISLSVKNDETHIEIICKYLVANNNQKLVIFNGLFTLFYENELTNLLKKYNIALCIECKVIKDGGNVYKLFHEAIRNAFKSVLIPNVEDLNELYKEGIELAECRTFAVFDDLFVDEPSRYEEMSCDAIVNVFILDNKVTGFVVQKSKKLDPFVLQDILSKANER